MRSRLLVCLFTAGAYLLASSPLAAGQDPAPVEQAHDHSQMDMSTLGWQFMQDGVLFGVFNHQGGERGSDEFKAPNWWMGMLSRNVGHNTLTLNGMFSLDPATAGSEGYAHLFQVGETLNGQPLIDRQHPHDFFMQLAAVWRIPMGQHSGFTIAGGPSGEPALGPVAFMHRASASEIPFATLSHHTFDSTHVAFGVITAAFDHGPFVVEGSVFNGREPNEHRWDFDFGKLDSVSGRVWYKPNEQWEFQVSTGHLAKPETLEEGDVERTTASAAWLRKDGPELSALTIGYGMNAAHTTTRHAVFGEFTQHKARTSLFTRAELVEVEANLLLTGVVPESNAASRKDLVGAVTLGAVRDLASPRGVEIGFGGSVTFYAIPDVLKPSCGDRPMSFQVYFRVRPPVGEMGRMWNMRMSQPMGGHRMAGTQM